MAHSIQVALVLDNVRSMLNTGSVFRSADAFSASEVLLCGITGKPPHREIQKTALGATETVSWSYFETHELLLNYLLGNGYKIVAVEQGSGSVMLTDYVVKPGEKYALIFGNEVTGVNDFFLKNSDDIIEIPQTGSKKSLNVSTCAGILLWEFFRQARMF